MNTNWKGSYGYDTKHSAYFNEHRPIKTETDVGVGTRQQTLKRCGIVRPNQAQNNFKNTSPQVNGGYCPWR